MADYELAGFFTESKTGKTGLTVTVDVYRYGVSGAIAADQSATEQGGGVYIYTHTDATAATYFGVFKTADTGVDAQHVGSMSAKQVPLIDAIVTAIAALPAALWAWTSRTLTQPAAAVVAAVTGSTLTITNRVTFSATISGLTIPATWSKV
jgi:hypothetical protein